MFNLNVWHMGCDWCDTCMHKGWSREVDSDAAVQAVRQRVSSIAEMNGTFVNWIPCTTDILVPAGGPGFDRDVVDQWCGQARGEVERAIERRDPHYANLWRAN